MSMSRRMIWLGEMALPCSVVATCEIRPNGMKAVMPLPMGVRLSFSHSSTSSKGRNTHVTQCFDISVPMKIVRFHVREIMFPMTCLAEFIMLHRTAVSAVLLTVAVTSIDDFSLKSDKQFIPNVLKCSI